MHNSHLIYLFFTNYTISQHLVVLTPPAKTRISSARRLGHRGSSRLLCCSRRDANVVTVLRISDSLFTVLRMSRLCRHNSQGKHHLFFFLDFNRWGCCFFPSLRPGHEKVHFSPPNTVALIHHIWNLGEEKKKNQTGGCVSRFAVLNSSGATEGPDFRRSGFVVRSQQRTVQFSHKFVETVFQ